MHWPDAVSCPCLVIPNTRIHVDRMDFVIHLPLSLPSFTHEVIVLKYHLCSTHSPSSHTLLSAWLLSSPALFDSQDHYTPPVRVWSSSQGCFTHLSLVDNEVTNCVHVISMICAWWPNPSVHVQSLRVSADTIFDFADVSLVILPHMVTNNITAGCHIHYILIIYTLYFVPECFSLTSQMEKESRFPPNISQRVPESLSLLATLYFRLLLLTSTC